MSFIGSSLGVISSFLHVKAESITLKMNTSPALVTLMLLFMLERTHGNSVTQKQDQVTLSEDEFLFINCTYSTTGYPTLFWYVQYPGEGPQLLLQVTTANNKGSSRGFEATYDKETMSFHLQKASVQESDSAVYYCALWDTVAETAGGLSTNSETQKKPDC